MSDQQVSALSTFVINRDECVKRSNKRPSDTLSTPLRTVALLETTSAPSYVPQQQENTEELWKILKRCNKHSRYEHMDGRAGTPPVFERTVGGHAAPRHAE